MHPDEQFSGDATEDKSHWTPDVWKVGPDALVAKAQHQLFLDRFELEDTALDGGDRAMSGTQSSPQNESDQIIDGSTPGDSPSNKEDGVTGGGRATLWRQNLKYLFRTEPLAAWSDGSTSGQANPPA